MSVKDEQQDLFSLLADRDFKAIKRYCERLNVFKVIGIEEMEIKHSNMLAWLINPNETHNLGDTVLKSLLNVFQKTRGSEAVEYSKNDYSDLSVYRELYNIDLLMVSKNNKLAVVIENKINAAESEGQLDDYKRTVEAKYPGYDYVFVFLTVDRSEPSNTNYIAVAYKEVYDCLQKILRDNIKEIDSEVLSFVLQYLTVLGEILMNDKELIEHCKRIYKNNKKELELIMKYGKPTLSPDNLTTFHTMTSTTANNKSNKFLTYLWFVPNKWISDGLISEEPKEWSVSFCFDFSRLASDDHTVWLGIYIGEVCDSKKRKDLVIYINDKIKEYNMTAAKDDNQEDNLKLINETNIVARKSTTVYQFKKFASKYVEDDNMDGLAKEFMMDMYNDKVMKKYTEWVSLALKNVH